ncbi:MAG TPA: pantoate--beta-alanine ligase [Allosphingosinicella sp.]|nr:pantoate--beta-alanine ligase [Allosphingosinicella sp.]
MQTIRDIHSLRKAVAELRKNGGKVALVPTMGALHAGHMALVAEAKARAEHVVVSIFVNPTQFGPNEDLGSYPRQEERDAELLAEAGCAILWLPEVGTMYSGDHSTSISVGGVSDGLDGAARPGHFAGVATVVAKLFNQVQPDIALFGEKDYQQLAMLRRMVRDLDIAVELVGVPTHRDADGLALSSRNAYLSTEERIAARALPRALGEAAQAILAGGAVNEALERARAILAEAGFSQVDYVVLCDAETLEPVAELARPARILAAARIGRTRLIDNLPVAPLA